MVNTFLVLAGVDYHYSAALLDPVRQRNQRREALQILNALQKFYLILQILGRTIPPDPTGWQEFILDCLRTYDRLPVRFLLGPEGQLLGPVPPGGPPAGTEILKRPGWISHSASRMWLLWPESLKEYIDAHIDVHIARGGHNEMRRYGVVGASRPPWTFSPEFARVHRAALLQKEIERKEAPFYQTQNLFLQAGSFTGYLWPCSPETPGLPDCVEPYLQYLRLQQKQQAEQ